MGASVKRPKGRTKPKQLSFSDLKDVLFPIDVVERLHARSDTETNAKWEDGDDLAGLVDEFGVKYGQDRVRRRFAVERGLSKATAREREGMARFFNPQARLDFDVLSYHQLRACKPAGVDKWKKLAQWAVESADDFGGRPAPVDAIIARRKGKGDEQPPWEGKLVRMHSLGQSLSEDTQAKPAIRTAAREFVESVEAEVRRIG